MKSRTLITKSRFCCHSQRYERCDRWMGVFEHRFVNLSSNHRKIRTGSAVCWLFLFSSNESGAPRYKSHRSVLCVRRLEERLRNNLVDSSRMIPCLRILWKCLNIYLRRGIRTAAILNPIQGRNTPWKLSQELRICMSWVINGQPRN